MEIDEDLGEALLVALLSVFRAMPRDQQLAVEAGLQDAPQLLGARASAILNAFFAEGSRAERHQTYLRCGLQIARHVQGTEAA